MKKSGPDLVVLNIRFRGDDDNVGQAHFLDCRVWGVGFRVRALFLDWRVRGAKSINHGPAHLNQLASMPRAWDSGCRVLCAGLRVEAWGFRDSERDDGGITLPNLKLRVVFWVCGCGFRTVGRNTGGITILNLNIDDRGPKPLHIFHFLPASIPHLLRTVLEIPDCSGFEQLGFVVLISGFRSSSKHPSPPPEQCSKYLTVWSLGFVGVFMIKKGPFTLLSPEFCFPNKDHGSLMYHIGMYSNSGSRKIQLTCGTPQS
jgi:hypothetical protein